jgi:hypothetical protein
LLGERGADRELVDELAARVWFELVRDDCERLQRYCSAKGMLTAFVAGFAKNVTLVYLRSERRRRIREGIAARRAPDGANEVVADRLMLGEFLATLSDTEGEFFRDCLAGVSHEPPNGHAHAGHLSQSYVRQLRHRVIRKLRAYFG